MHIKLFNDIKIDENNIFQCMPINREKFAESIYSIISNIDDKAVISLNAPWGEGKTTFLNQLKLYIEKNKKGKVIYLDAYENDFNSDPLFAISSEINKFIALNADIFPSHISSNFKSNLIKLTKISAPVLTNIALKAISCGAVDLNDLNTNGALGNYISEMFDIHQKRNETIKTFYDELCTVGDTVKSKTSCPLIYIIDELDRCRPSYALEIIEKIKHFFNAKNVVFILSMNKEQMLTSIKSVYGEDIDAETYLQKFINIEASLPKLVNYNGVDDYDNYCAVISDYCELNTISCRNIKQYMAFFSKTFSFTMRDIQKCYSYISILYNAFHEFHGGHCIIVTAVSILKVKYYDLFCKIKNQTATLEEITNHNFMQTILRNPNKIQNLYENLQSTFYMTMCTEKQIDEFLTIRENSKLYNSLYTNNYMNRDRRTFISEICNNIDSFVVN